MSVSTWFAMCSVIVLAPHANAETANSLGIGLMVAAAITLILEMWRDGRK